MVNSPQAKNALPRNPNHPKKGSRIKVEPIRDLEAIKKIKKLLSGNMRDLCLFSLGINTAYRANELLSIRIGSVAHLRAGDILDLKQSKTNTYRAVTLNGAAAQTMRNWVSDYPDPKPDAPLFPSRKGGALKVTTLVSMVKEWCNEVGLNGNFGTHTLRKTWGYHCLRSQNAIPAHLVLPTLMVAYGHSNQWQTLDYLCIQADEVAELFMGMEL